MEECPVCLERMPITRDPRCSKCFEKYFSLLLNNGNCAKNCTHTNRCKNVLQCEACGYLDKYHEARSKPRSTYALSVLYPKTLETVKEGEEKNTVAAPQKTKNYSTNFDPIFKTPVPTLKFEKKIDGNSKASVNFPKIEKAMSVGKIPKGKVVSVDLNKGSEFFNAVVNSTENIEVTSGKEPLGAAEIRSKRMSKQMFP